MTLFALVCAMPYTFREYDQDGRRIKKKEYIGSQHKWISSVMGYTINMCHKITIRYSLYILFSNSRCIL